MSVRTSRRFFIGGAVTLGAFGGCRFLPCAHGAADRSDVRLRFGVVSDIHISAVPENLFDFQYDVAVFRRTLEWFRDQGVDAVMIPGDLAHNGTTDQLRGVAQVWNEVFPNGRAPDGRRVERLFVTGNHDWDGWRYGDYANYFYKDEKERAAKILANDLKGRWERVFDEPFAPVWKREIRGFTFIGANWVSDRCRHFDEIGVAPVSDFIAREAGKVDPRQPFFYFQHPHPKNTCYGTWAWGHDAGEATRALSPFANAVAFSGHSHYTLTDERSIWQGAFTSIGAGSLHHTGLPYDEFGPVGYENTPAPKADRDRYDPFKVAEQAMKQCCQQGMLVSVYDDRIVLARLDCRNNRSLGDWVLPLPAAEDRPFAFASRRAREKPPRFPEGAKTKVVTYVRSNRAGQKVQVWEVVVPAAVAAGGTRPFRYEVKAVREDGTSELRQFLATGFNLPLEDPEAAAPMCCPFAKDRLPLGKFRFEVTPISSLGTRGETLVSEPVENDGTILV